ncbi:MAG TPA: hypothetical protein VNQ73_05305 [Ilumatobacter sp.]|nr:hypothetical protein [Ilumatobacter sp.]
MAARHGVFRRAGVRIAPFAPGLGLALVVAAIAAVMLGSQRPGHWWGDDWALYIRQAEGLLHLDPGDVARANEFTVTHSSGAPFSPPLYPWGFPLALAVAIPFVGSGVDDLAIVQVVAALVFACAWFALARPRLGVVVALVGVPAVAMTPVLLSWGELIQSEWVFLASAAVGLAGLDLLVRRERLLDVTRRAWPLAVLGVWAAFVFEVRREGLAMIAAIGVAQLAALLADRRSLPWGDTRRLARLAGRVVLPHLCAAAVTLAVKVALPSVIVPNYEGNTIRNTWRRWDRNVDHVLEIAGFKRPQVAEPTLFGHTGWATVAIGVWVSLAVLGLVLAVSVRARRDAHLAAYAAAAFVIGASAQASLDRYFATVAPVLTLLGAAALAWLARVPVQRFARVGLVVPALLVSLALGGIVFANGRDARVRLRNTERILDAGSIEWGAQHPVAQEMFAAVRQLTGPDDVVASPKARSMGLLTERPSVQVDDYRPVPPSLAIALLVTEPTNADDDKVAEQIAADPAWREVWRNTRFVLYEPAS